MKSRRLWRHLAISCQRHGSSSTERRWGYLVSSWSLSLAKRVSAGVQRGHGSSNAVYRRMDRSCGG